MNYIRLLFAISFLFLIQVAYGQNIKGNIGIEDSHRPNAPKGDAGTSLVSVDPYTGIGSVNIPIHSQTFAGLNFDVSLGYNLKGIKLDEIASSIGLGWSLQAGGSIVREVNGLEDEVTLPTYFVDTLDTLGTNPKDSLQGCMVPGADTNVVHHNADDTEHDLFHLNLLGRSLSFAFSYSGGSLVCQTYPKSELKIEVKTKDLAVNGTDSIVLSGFYNHSGLDSMHGILTFTITDEKGNIFYFDRGDYQVKPYLFSSGTFTDTSGKYYAISKWDLKKVETYSGMVIEYEYLKKYLEYLENETEILYPKVMEYGSGSTILYDPLEIKEQRWKGYKTHISKITYPNSTTVSFNLLSSAYTRCDCEGDFRLTKITVETKHPDNNVSAKVSYQLNQAYYNTPITGLASTEHSVSNCETIYFLIGAHLSAGVDTTAIINRHRERGMRLKLKSINRLGTDNSTTEDYYTFGYNSTYTLPYRFSPQKDFYGYYNAETPTQYVRTHNYPEYLSLSIPYHPADGVNRNYTDNCANWGAGRYFSLGPAQALVLNSVKNCSGGVDSIVYTNYTLANPDCSYGNVEVFGGSLFGGMWSGGSDTIGCALDTEMQGDTVNDGLVVGQIISKDKYQTQGTLITDYSYSYGQRFNRGGYTWYLTGNGGALKKVFTNFFITPHNYVHGSNHGFSEVSVTQKGYYGQQLSKTKYKFYNLIFQDNGPDSTCLRRPTGANFHTMPADMKKYRMGLPYEISQYDAADNMLSKDEMTYEYIADAIQIENSRPYVLGTSMSLWTYHVLDYERMRLKTRITEEYTNSKTVQATDTFHYDSNDNIKRVCTVDSKGDTYKSHVYFNYDNAYGVTAISTMNSNNWQFPLITDKWHFVGADSNLIDFKLVSPATYAGKVWFPRSFNLIGSEPLSSANANSTSYINKANALANSGSVGSSLMKTKEVTLYDNMGNPREVKYNNEDVYESKIWDSKLGRIIADVKNARFQDIAYTTFGSSEKGNWNYTGAIYSSAGVTGPSAFYYASGVNSNTISSNPLDKKKYILSFWANVSTLTSNVAAGLYAPPTYSGGSSITFSQQTSIGSWYLYTAIVTPPDSAYKVNILLLNGTVNIDEIRLHPADAMMTTYTHAPMFGATSETSPSNTITYYEYDYFGRLIYIKDMNGNVIKKIEVKCNSVDVNAGSEES